jgi:hypothetical protein
MPRPTLLVLSQVYVPDPAAVGQYMADAAEAIAARGYDVVVLTSARGYDDPSQRYARREQRRGVSIRRLPWCSFGKGSIAVRLVGGLSFVIQAIVAALRLRRIDGILVSTSPPLASLAALAIARLRRVPIKYWVMDLNPDQAVALGVLQADAPAARAFDALNRRVLERATDVVVLDRFMAARVNAKRDVRDKLAVIPPWPLEGFLEPVPHARNAWRRAHGLEGRIVVMYSGNHGPSNPITTILEAARRLRDEPRLAFVFVGGGVGKAEVERAAGPNVISLPYQPLETLSESLSAADVHLVTVGDAVVGIVHPCKVYNAMAVSRPVLLVGPAESHVGDLMTQADVGWRLAHGDVDAAVACLRSLLTLSPDEIGRRGAAGRGLVEGRWSRDELCRRFCDVILRGLPAAPRPVTLPAASAAGG